MAKSVEDRKKYILSVMLTFLVILCWNVHIIMICQSMAEFICIRLKADIREGEKYDGYIAHTTNVAQQWIQYFADGGRLAAPEAYIQKS